MEVITKFRFLFFCALLVNVISAQDDDAEESCKLDVMFVNDASGSIGHEDYRKSLDFMINTLGTLKNEINRDDVQVGILTYADNPQVVVEFGPKTFEELEDLIDSLYFSYVGGNTNIGKAITLGTEHLVSRRRAGVKSEMVVITDGISLDSVTQPSANARAQGIELFSIGVAEYEKSQLEDIADNNQNNILIAKDYDALNALKQMVLNCDPPPPPAPPIDDPIDPCDPNPCLNGGVCKPTNINDGYTCECPYPYGGSNCQEDLQWYLWSGWSACSVSCGNGIQLKFRRCKSHWKAPELCVRQQNKERVCSLPSCPVMETALMGMTMDRPFTDDLLDPESDAYKSLATEVQDLITKAMNGVDGVTLNEIKSIVFSSGSIKAEVLMNMMKEAGKEIDDIADEMAQAVSAISDDVVVEGASAVSEEDQKIYEAKLEEAAQQRQQMKDNAEAAAAALEEEVAKEKSDVEEKGMSLLEKMKADLEKKAAEMKEKLAAAKKDAESELAAVEEAAKAKEEELTGGAAEEAKSKGTDLMAEMMAKAEAQKEALKAEAAALEAEAQKELDGMTEEAARTTEEEKGSNPFEEMMAKVEAAKKAAKEQEAALKAEAEALKAEAQKELDGMSEEDLASKQSEAEAKMQAMKDKLAAEQAAAAKSTEEAKSTDPFAALKAKAEALKAEAQKELDGMNEEAAKATEEAKSSDPFAEMKAKMEAAKKEAEAQKEALKAEAAALEAKAQKELDGMSDEDLAEKQSEADAMKAEYEKQMQAMKDKLAAEQAAAEEEANNAMESAKDKSDSYAEEMAAAEAEAKELLEQMEKDAEEEMKAKEAEAEALAEQLEKEIAEAESIPSYATIMFDMHNNMRALHGSPPMTISSQLMEQAKSYADHVASTGVMKHAPASERPNQGENMAFMAGFDEESLDSASMMITQAWYNEEQMYDYNNPGSNPGATGHFSQVVWKDSTEFGVGMTVVNTDEVYIVARYSSAGNKGGQYEANVLPPQNA